MKGAKDTSRKGTALYVTCYLLGIATVAVFSCEGALVTETSYAAAPNEDSQDPATAAFEFDRDGLEISDAQVSAYIEGSSEDPLKDYRLYVTDELIVVEVDTLKDKTVHFSFIFLDNDGNEVGIFKAQADINRKLPRYPDNEFGDNEKVVNHTQPLEAEIEQDDSISVALDKEMTLRYMGQTYKVRQVVNTKDDSEVFSHDSTLVEINSTTFGIISDAGLDDIIHIESEPAE